MYRKKWLLNFGHTHLISWLEKKYGEIRSLLEKQGTPLEHADLQIASIALYRNMTLITGNIRHFKRVPNLKIENWLQ